MLIRPCDDLSGVIVDTKQDEDNSNFIFPLGAGIPVNPLNPSALYFSGYIHAYAISFLNHDEIIYAFLDYHAC